MVLFLIYLMILFIDLKHFIIPDILNYSIIVLAIIKNFLPDLDLIFTQDLIFSIVGGISGYLSIWLIIYLYKQVRKKEGMGLGDAKLLAVIGFWFGWISIPFVIFLSSTIALIYVIPNLLNKSKKLSSQIPFGPHIILATIIFVIFKDSFLKILI